MSKGKMKRFTCPGCGWTVKTPFGEDDTMARAIERTKHMRLALKPRRTEFSKNHTILLAQRKPESKIILVG